MDDDTLDRVVRAVLHHQGRPARAPGSASARSTASPPSRAATSASTARPARARPSPCSCRAAAAPTALARRGLGRAPSAHRSRPRSCSSRTMRKSATFAETLLGELGHKVTLRDSGEEALELDARRATSTSCSATSSCPGMGGLELAEQLAREQPDLPVVLATGYSRRDRRGRQRRPAGDPQALSAGDIVGSAWRGASRQARLSPATLGANPRFGPFEPETSALGDIDPETM